MFKCSECQTNVNQINYKNGKPVCNFCNNTSLSGKWERNNAMERSAYAKDLLQPGQPGFKQIYGKPKNNTTKAKI